MFRELKERVLKANLMLATSGLVTLTWGNVSEKDSANGVIAIKASGVPYEEMTTRDIVVLDLEGKVVEGKLNPSSDTPTHLELYKAFPEVGGVVHTHSRWATIFAQSQKYIPLLGTTHADTFYGDIPCTRTLTDAEINKDYEKEIGKVIVETFSNRSPMDIPAVLVASHGPFTWGETALKAIKNAIVLEEVAMMAWATKINNSKATFQQSLADKHYFRKHGPNAYYGQKEEK